MSCNLPRITVSIATTETDVNQALEFCGSVYERSYGTRWTVPPDLFFVAKEAGKIVATGGLTFAALHSEIASERYFHLSKNMQRFIEANRERIGEFGRFASAKVRAAKAILHSALAYCTASGIDFLFAWANPSVYKYTTHRLGIHFWPISVPLDLERALNDPRWASPPLGFFQRKQPPALHVGIVPFWENAKMTLADEIGLAMTESEWHASDETPVRAVRSSLVHSPARLIRSDADIAGATSDGGVFPNFTTYSDAARLAPREPPKTD
jgi:hypothetical protein